MWTTGYWTDFVLSDWILMTRGTMKFLSSIDGCIVLLMLCVHIGAAQTGNTTTTTTTTTTTSVPSTIRPGNHSLTRSGSKQPESYTESIQCQDPRCTPQSLRVRISDDEDRGCQHPYPLNISCTNWGYREKMRFSIESWMYANIITLEYSFSAYPAVCVGGRLKDMFNNYTTILNVSNGQGQKTNEIPLTFEIVEVNDTPRIRSPGVIDVVERDTGVQKWNITYTDPDDWKDFPSNYSISSPDMPEQLKINKTTRKMGDFTIQEFRLWQVKPFDADIFPSENFGPQFENREESFKRSAADRKRYKRTKRPQSHRNEMVRQQSRKQTLLYSSRVKRQKGLEGNDFPGPTTNFTIQITDQTGLGSEFTVTVNIGDVNDNEPVCTTPETIAIARELGMYQELKTLFELRTICSDPDYNSQNQITDYRLSNMKDCLGAFGISRYGSLNAEVPLLPRNMSVCEFDVVAMDPLYATSVHLKLVFGECEASLDARGVLWNTSQPGRTNYMSCPQGYTGTVSRYCNSYAIYDPAVYDCTSETITNISRKMNNLYFDTSSNISITTTLYELKNATDKTLMVGDVRAVFYTLRTATSIVKYRNVDESNKTEAFLDVANNLLKEDNSETWMSIMYKSGTGVEQVTETLDDYVKSVVLADQRLYTKPHTYTKDNLMVSLGPLSSCSSDMEFPDRTTSIPCWIKHSDNKVRLQCSSAGKTSFFSNTFYKNISNLVSPRAFNKNLENATVNSGVISFSLFPEQPKKLEPPIEVTFDVINAGLKNPKCSYWKTGPSFRGHGYWATDGCRLKSFSNGIVTCLCDHLTNFAVLMSPADPTESHVKHAEALSVISLVGCVISMICLLATIVVYIFYWRVITSERSVILLNLSLCLLLTYIKTFSGKVIQSVLFLIFSFCITLFTRVIKSERSVILLHLCITLFIAYLFFLAGVNQTADKVMCKVMAVLLHFIYLEVFLLMLVQGINLALTVLKPLQKQRFGWQMTLASYGASALIVAISMGATELKGYGNEKFCWLSVDSGLIWAFVIPVLFVIVVNTVIIVIVLRGMFGTAALKKKTDQEKLRTGIRSLLILMPVMGITWIFGLFAINRETIVFQYFFAIFNSIQGLLIFIFHCILNKKIQEAFKKTKAQLFVSETVSTEGERLPMKSVETSNTLVK